MKSWKRQASHNRFCQCAHCVGFRFNQKQNELREKMLTPRLPSKRNQMVFVQGYFRRQPNYMSKDAALRRLWAGFIRGLMAPQDSR